LTLKSEEPIVDYARLDKDGSYTYLNYMTWKFKERVELIKGRVFKMSPAPSTRHQEVLAELHVLFYQSFNKHNCKVFFAPFDVRLPMHQEREINTVVQPDLCVVCDNDKLDDKGCNGVPDLMLEVLSPSNTKHDLETKFNLYEEAGVPEYWIVNPDEKYILVYTLVDGKYVGSKPFVNANDVIESSKFEELKVRVGEVYQ
jgi:Uma2 family endonuclease